MERYITTREIGSGSFGKVFEVEAKSTGIHYVAKIIDLSKLDRKHAKSAEKEIQVLSKLNHPNIVRYKEAYIEKMSLYIIMEFCDLGDLHGFIQDTRQRNDSIPEPLIMEFFVQICLALEYTHRQRILHRDVKTKNIFLKKGNIVKLGDFGVAKVLENSLELAETCTGSPFYISPEICNNQPYDKKSDVWALGCVLFEITTLRYAFTGKNMKSLLLKITTGDHAPLPANVAPKIRHLIRKLLACNPRQRPNVESILTWPFVSEVADKIHCRIRTVGHIKRCQSGENLQLSKQKKALLPLSKSCLNLCSSITEPVAKYQPAVPKLRTEKKFKDLPMQLNNTKAKNLGTKRKNLPKSDSQYYSMIAGCARGTNNSLVHNIFEKPAEEEKDSKVLFSQAKEKFEHRESGLVEDVTPCERKKWEVTTLDKNELITLLNEASLVNTFESSKEVPGKETRTPTIDELLFSSTLDLPNVPPLQPQRLYVEETPAKVIDAGIAHEINDLTFCIGPSPASEYEMLEKRRSALEKTLGVKCFLEIYKFLENSVNVLDDAKKLEVGKMFNLNDRQVGEIFQLVQDDLRVSKE